MNKINVSLIIIWTFLLASCGENMKSNSNINTKPNSVISSETWSINNPEIKTITKTIEYPTPERPETANFTISLNNDNTVNSVSVSIESHERETNYAVSQFNKNINSKVSGKKLSEINIDAIGWASLTTAAFNSVIKN